MGVFANAMIEAETDGIPYAVGAALPANEADLYNQETGDPIPVLYGQAILAIVTLTLNEPVTGNTSYCVLQTDLGDGNWIDCCWCQWTGTSGQAVFVLSSGSSGGNAFQQVRQPDTAPGNTAANQIPLGGRCRFVGQAAITAAPGGSSSSSSGQHAQVTAKILYKLLGLL